VRRSFADGLHQVVEVARIAESDDGRVHVAEQVGAERQLQELCDGLAHAALSSSRQRAQDGAADRRQPVA
jgi:hypothetical protein